MSSWCDVGGRAGRQSPDDVVGDPGAEHLALRVLQDDRGAAQSAEPDGAGPLDGARGRFASGQHQHQRRLAGAVGAGHRDVFAGLDGQRHRAERVVVGSSDSGSGRRAAAPARAPPARRRSADPACARRECTSSRAITRDSAHQPISVTMVMLSTDDPPIRNGQ